jgi:NDP-sugar pyrophosphorylase family protein
LVANFRGLVLACVRTGDDLCDIAGPGCPYTLPIAGRPLISHAVRSLREAGVSEVLVIAGESIFEDIVAAVGETDVAIRYSVHADADCESVGLQAAAEALGRGPVLIHLADALFPRGLEGIEEGGDRVFVSRGCAVAFALETLPDPATGLTAAEAAWDAERVEVDAWKYDATVDGVLEANQMALDELKRGRIGADLSNASVQGRVSVHPSAVLEGAKLRGPVYVGPGAVVAETYVGPYTSIGDDVRLEGVEIEHSIVLPGATIRYPGRRIEASLVGERAQIGRDFSLPSALRLRIGRGADIQLS